MPERTRGYIRTNSTFRSLFWVHNNKPNEMLLGLYGLRTKVPTLRRLWPDRELRSADLKSIRYRFGDATEVGEHVDHITCHADGRFHVKTLGGETPYIHQMQRVQPIGAETSTFLNVQIVSDLCENYLNTSENPKPPSVLLGADADQFVSLRAWFSGAKFDLMPEVTAVLGGFHESAAVVTLEFGTLRGVVVSTATRLTAAARDARPRGTLLSFNFPVAPDRWHVKTFLFD